MGLRRYVPLFLALPLLALPIGDVLLKRQEISGFVHDEGTVVSLVPTSCGEGAGHRCWYPIIEYQLGPGKKNLIRSDVASYPAPVIGSAITLLIDPRNRYDARVAGLSGYWFPSLITSTIAFAFILLAVLAVVFPQFNVRAPARGNRRMAHQKSVGLFDDLTGSLGAVPGVAPSGAMELRAALLALNRDDLQWSIQTFEEDGPLLVAALKFEDPQWRGRIHDARIRDGVRILLKLHPEIHTVRSIDEQFLVKWQDGIAHIGTKPNLSRGVLISQRGQLRQRVNEITFGRRADGSFGETGHFVFSSQAMKDTLRQTVTQHGWVWQGRIIGPL